MEDGWERRAVGYVVFVRGGCAVVRRTSRHHDYFDAVFDAACRVTPTGKQNSFASHSLADVALLVVRPQTVPCSLATAFERAVPESPEGYTSASAEAMLERYTRIRAGYELGDDRAALFSIVDGREGDPLEADRVESVGKLSELWDLMRAYVDDTANAPAA